MNEAKMKLWLYLLENTSLPQTREQLGTPKKGMCCMGLANYALFLEGDHEDDPFMRSGHQEELGLNGRVSDEELEYIRGDLGYWSVEPESEANSRAVVLSVLNDMEDLSFREIATFIRDMGWDKNV